MQVKTLNDAYWKHFQSSSSGSTTTHGGSTGDLKGLSVLKR